jgi:flagellar P-ring protein precursor FlgI
MAQGSLVVGAFAASGSDGLTITVHIPSAGRIPGGATAEKMAPTSMGSSDALAFNLNEPDFTTAKRMADAINNTTGIGSARPLDATSVLTQALPDTAQRVSNVSVLENLNLEPGDASAEIIINSRAGTVVIG